MKVFDAYSQYYDLLYKDKDYLAEAEYIASHIKRYLPKASRLLDLGCGTGIHAEHLARMGYEVVGVDVSESMLARAEARKAKLPLEVSRRLTFVLGDIRSIRTGESYDAVISLFHVMSYQTTNADLEAAFVTAATHLNVGGVFMYDYWYGPAVLIQKPELRVKRLEDNIISVTRIAEPVLYENENIVDVNYTVFIEIKTTSKVEQIHETHKMRYLFLPELMMFQLGKFKECENLAWMTNNCLDIKAWSGFSIFTKLSLTSELSNDR